MNLLSSLESFIPAARRLFVVESLMASSVVQGLHGKTSHSLSPNLAPWFQILEDHSLVGKDKLEAVDLSKAQHAMVNLGYLP